MTSAVRRVGRWSPHFIFLLAACSSAPAHAAAPTPGPPLSIRKATGSIKVDGALDDQGWQGADSVTVWFETRVGDNVEPQVRNVGYLPNAAAYLYAAFYFEVPSPQAIRAPRADQDAIPPPLDSPG